MSSPSVLRAARAAFVAAAVGAPFAPVVAVEDALEAIAPYMLNYRGGEEALVQRLADIKATSGIARFLLGAPHNIVRIDSCVPPAGYEEYGRKLARINAALASRGVTCGYYAAPTMNMGRNRPGGDCILEDGSKRLFTGCPADPAFRARLVANISALAMAGQPGTIILEDDYRYFGKGCFCERHLNAFSASEGLAATNAYTRETLAKALMRSDAGSDAFRLRWHAFQTAYLVSLGRELAQAVAAVSPGTRIGLCAPGGFPEPDTLAMARAAAGGKRPFVRWYGSFYGVDRPVDAFGILRSAQWARENLADGSEFIYEADTVPHNAFYASAARMCGLISATCAMGFDRPLFWSVGDGVGDLATSPDYLLAYRRNVARFAEIRRMGRLGRPVGLQVAFDPYYRFRREGGADRASPADWYAALNRLGFPVTTAPSPIRFFSGFGAFAALSNAEVEEALRGRAFLDGAAAEAARRRGFGSLIGVKTAPWRPVDFTGEHATDGSWTSSEFECTFHQNYGLDSVRVSNLALDGAEERAFYYRLTPDRHARPSLTRFRNAKGGRVSVMALNVGQATKTPNLFCFPKRRLLMEEIAWLGGADALPVCAHGLANLYVLARDTPEGLFVHAMNLSCDTRQELAFSLAPRWAGGEVELLDGAQWRRVDATWSADDGGRAVLRVKATVPVYGTCALRIAAGKPSAAVSQDLSFRASLDGTEQRYMLIEPPSASSADVLIALHGHGSDRRQFAEHPRGECRAAREAAAARGMLFVSPDYRARTSWMGPAAEADMLDLIALLKRERGVRRVFLCGGSMGGTGALTFTARHPDLIAGVTAFNPLADHLSYTNFQQAIAASFGGDRNTAAAEYRARSALYFPERFTMPVSITLGGADRTVPPDSARMLAQEIRRRRPGLIYLDDVPTRGHATDHAASAQALREMFRRADAATR